MSTHRERGPIDFSLEKMEERHLDGILEVENAVFSSPWTRGMFRSEFSNPLAYYRVAMAGGRVVGYAGMWTVFDEGHITNIAVHPDFQRSGVATALLTDFMRLAAEYEMSLLTLEVRVSNIAAQSLYQKFLFEQEGLRRQYYEDNHEDALIMTRRLRVDGADSEKEEEHER